ncbi:MAG: hypothetical protein Phog2KO_25330 [Phototrophicaceae bacterium]
MSERPENPLDEQSSSTGGWHSPTEASPWQTPETPTVASVAWRTISALPEDVDAEPQKRGDWHLPDEADTLFTATDVVEVSDDTRQPTPTPATSIASPEDLIADILGQSRTSAPRPEDFVYPTQARDEEDETIAADMYDEGKTLLIDEEGVTSAAEPLLDLDEDDESLSMGEYMALASMAQGDNDFSGIDEESLSPAERAVFNIARQVEDEMDTGREPALSDEDTITMEDTSAQGANQAADYARQQLEALNQGNEADVPEPYQAEQSYQQTQQPQYTPEQIELAGKFRETKRQVAVLRQMAAQGQIDQNELQTRLQEHTILDEQENWWMVGYETDEWYRYNNQTGDWEIAQPPVPLDAGQNLLTETGLGQAAPDVLANSLPYLPNDGSQAPVEEYSDPYDNTQYSQAQENYTQQYGTDEPLPYGNQPAVDPNLTQVGRSVDRTQLNYADETVQGMTVPANTFDNQQTMPSASLGDLVYDDGQAGIPPVDQYQADGLNDYNTPEAAPDYDALASQQRNRTMQYIGFGVFGIVIVALLTVGVFVLVAMNQYSTIINEWQDEIALLGSQEFDFQTATILAADGSVIAELTGEQGARTVVSVENGDVSPFFVHAIVASEDPRFYENPGFDVMAIGRAFFQNYFAGEVESGASTITQQIVRERVLGSNVVSFDRKLTEILLSMEVARQYSKNEILDIYINEFFYGEQSYGVEAASEFYFDVAAADLNAAQAATLAGILPSPSSTNPVVAPAAAFSNMRIILRRMIDADCLYFQHGIWAQQGQPFCVSEDTLVSDGNGGQVPLYTLNPDGTFSGFLAVQIAEVETRRYEQRQSDILYPHFVFYVLGELDAAYGRGAYIERGFTVQTTLIPRIQNTAEAAIQQRVAQLTLNGVQTGAAIVTDPNTGAILSMVGSPDFNNEEIEGQNNNTISLQQPGSAIKPIVYATALTGTTTGYYTPASILWDVTTQYNLDGTIYTPTNFDGRFRGPVPLRYALAQSLNIPAIKTYGQFGSQAFVDIATAMGLVFDLNPDDDIVPTFGLPTAIGATEVSLMDLTHAYGVIAADGVRTELYAVETITERTSSGAEQAVELTANLLHDVQTQAISPQVAYLLQNILSDDTARTTSVNGVGSTFPANSAISGASLGLNNRDQVGVKTGTNNTENGNPSRIWTVGFTNNYAVGVWLGTVQQGTPMTGSITGLTGAAPAWNAIMSEALNGVNPGTFDSPSGVVSDTVCQLTGTLAPQATANCPTRVTEIFLQTQPPPAADAGFAITININSWNGLRANQWCAENVVTETFANINDTGAINWLTSTAQGQQILSALGLPASLQAPPAGECEQGQILPTVLINFPQENTELLGNVAVTGQVNANELQRWDLLISEVGTDNFRSIMPQARTDQVLNSGITLYEWDSRTVQNGAYILRLAAYSTSGGFIFRDVRVTVQNPEPTAVPVTPTPIIVETTPIPFDTLPSATPDTFNNP